MMCKSKGTIREPAKEVLSTGIAVAAFKGLVSSGKSVSSGLAADTRMFGIVNGKIGLECKGA